MMIDDKLRKIELLNNVHERIIKLDRNIEFRVFPIYIRYIKGDEVFAVLYFKNKSQLELGINSKSKPSVDFQDAKQFAYKEINYKVFIDRETDLDKLMKSIRKQYS